MTGQHSKGTPNMCVPPHDEEYSVLNMDTDVITFRELGVAPLNDTGTDVQDELPTPTDTPVSGRFVRQYPRNHRFSLSRRTILIWNWPRSCWRYL